MSSLCYSRLHVSLSFIFFFLDLKVRAKEKNPYINQRKVVKELETYYGEPISTRRSSMTSRVLARVSLCWNRVLEVARRKV